MNVSAPIRVLISDALSEQCLRIFHNKGIDTHFDPALGKNPNKLLAVIGDFDGLAIRSATRVHADIIKAGKKLRVIGRAGIGVDNIDMAAASKHGIVVMNTPFGNSITTAEHTIAMLLALARQIPKAHISTRSGLWQKSKFTGVEITNKTLGIIGCGNIGKIVAERARGLAMRVVAYDPYLSETAACALHIKKVDLDSLLKTADFITLHTPLTDKTRNILDRDRLALLKPDARLINCARGGLVDESALADAITNGRIAGAAFDVFVSEPPAKDNPLLALDQVIVTPHLGAATVEAQENVAVQIAETMADYLTTGAVNNALNMPSISAAQARAMHPWLKLANHIGRYIGQMTHTPISTVSITYDGLVCDMNLAVLDTQIITALIQQNISGANMVSSPLIAKAKGINIHRTTQGKSGVFDGYIKVGIVTNGRTVAIAGTVFSGSEPRFIQIKDIDIEVAIGQHMLYLSHQDALGVVGTLGTILGNHGINIAHLNLGRNNDTGQAIAMLYVDGALSETILTNLRETGLFRTVQALTFDV